jgi:polynucleotide 5'-hydroxyl-kinase GRC3/NOL9
MEIVPGTGWEDVFNELLNSGGRAVIVGATDSGKSSLARYLVERLLEARKRVCLVDADVGQSVLGLPGTISMKRFDHESDLRDYRFRGMFFVGDINPAKRILLMIDGTMKMVAACGEAADVTLVDTTGLVSGKAAEVLKIGKIKAINPRHIIALQRADELDPLLNRMGITRILRPGVSSMARTRKAAQRALYRREKLWDYFNSPGNAEFRLSEKEAKFLHRGKICELSGGLFPGGSVIGLNRGCETLALGLVVEMEDHAVIFRSPLSSPGRVSTVEFGDIRLTDWTTRTGGSKG